MSMDFDVVPYEDIVWGERIGGGSFGSVFKGQYLGVDIAIKEIHSSTEYNVHKYFEREWRIMRECRHPNIVLFLGLCREPSGEGRVFIVSEFVPCGNLRSLIRSTVPFPWRRRLSFATDIACAVAYLHARQCIHRDLKGENLLISSNGRIKVGDFGFARITSRNEEEMKNLTYCGTDGYMSPEIVMGENFDLPTDVYSLGIIFIEILTRIVVGAKVYTRKAPAITPDPDAVRRHASPGCPPGFIDLALQCCSFAAEDRPTLPDIIHRLRAIEAQAMESDEVDYKCSELPFRREGKRAMPLFDFSSDDDAEAHIDDQVLSQDDATLERLSRKALNDFDIVIDGMGASACLLPSPAKGGCSSNLFYNTASEMRSCDIMMSAADSSHASLAVMAVMPFTHSEEEVSSTRTVRGVPKGCSNTLLLPESPDDTSCRLDVNGGTEYLSCGAAPLLTLCPLSDGGNFSHHFASLNTTAGGLSAKRITSSFPANLVRVLLPRTLARMREKCMVCSKRLNPRSGFHCDGCGIFVHAKCITACLSRCRKVTESDISI